MLAVAPRSTSLVLSATVTTPVLLLMVKAPPALFVSERSEERRAGKEGLAGWPTDHPLAAVSVTDLSGALLWLMAVRATSVTLIVKLWLTAPPPSSVSIIVKLSLSAPQ